MIAPPVEIAKGQRDEVALQPNLVFEYPMKEGARAVVVAHNHPSGDPIPSEGDVEMTRKRQSRLLHPCCIGVGGILMEIMMELPKIYEYGFLNPDVEVFK